MATAAHLLLQFGGFWSRNLKAMCLRGFKPAIIWSTGSIDHIRLENLVGNANFSWLCLASQKSLLKIAIHQCTMRVYYKLQCVSHTSHAIMQWTSPHLCWIQTAWWMPPTSFRIHAAVISFPCELDHRQHAGCRHRRWSIMAEDRKSTWTIFFVCFSLCGRYRTWTIFGQPLGGKFTSTDCDGASLSECDCSYWRWDRLLDSWQFVFCMISRDTVSVVGSLKWLNLFDLFSGRSVLRNLRTAS